MSDQTLQGGPVGTGLAPSWSPDGSGSPIAPSGSPPEQSGSPNDRPGLSNDRSEVPIDRSGSNDRSRPPIERVGQSDAPEGTAQSHTIVVLAHNRHGALDRIVGVLRRRRAKMEAFAVGRSELPDVVRISIVMNDSEVAVEQLVEQLRKIVDVKHVSNLSSDQTIARELALIKVNSSEAQHASEIIELGHLFGAHVASVTQQTVTLEVTGSEEKVEKLVNLLQRFGIRELARTGCVAMTRGEEDV